MIDIERVLALISIILGWFFTFQQAMKIREERKNLKLQNRKLELEIKKNSRRGR